MSANVSSWLRILRVPNLPTVPGDVLAGFFLCGLSAADPAFYRLLPLIASSLLLYSAGLILNDWSDVEKDKEERPDRPIPTTSWSKWWGRAVPTTAVTPTSPAR